MLYGVFVCHLSVLCVCMFMCLGVVAVVDCVMWCGLLFVLLCVCKLIALFACVCRVWYVVRCCSGWFYVCCVCECSCVRLKISVSCLRFAV